MIPMKLTNENESGTMMSWGNTAAEGVCARDAKSGALLWVQNECPSRNIWRVASRTLRV